MHLWRCQLKMVINSSSESSGYFNSEETRRIKVGYQTSYIIEEICKPLKGFRCNHFGHMISDCKKKSVGRKVVGKCLSCLGEGYVAKNCKNDLVD